MCALGGVLKRRYVLRESTSVLGVRLRILVLQKRLCAQRRPSQNWVLGGKFQAVRRPWESHDFAFRMIFIKLIRIAKSWTFVLLYSPVYVHCASTVCFIQSTVRPRTVDCIKHTVDAQWTHSGRTVDCIKTQVSTISRFELF